MFPSLSLPLPGNETAFVGNVIILSAPVFAVGGRFAAAFTVI